MRIFLLTVVVASFGCLDSGVRLRITKEGVQKSINQALPRINSVIRNIKLTKEDFPPNDGPIIYSLDIQIEPTEGTKGNQVSVAFNTKQNSIEFELKGYSFKISYCIDFQLPLMTGVKTTSSLSFVLKKFKPILFIKDETPSVEVKIDELSLKDQEQITIIDNMFIQTYKTMVSLVKGLMLKIISTVVKPKIENYVQTELNNYIKVYLPFTQEIPTTDLSISTRLTQTPLIKKEEIDIYLYGVFFKTENDEPESFNHSPFQDISFTNQKAATFFISESTIQSLINSSSGMEYKYSSELYSYTVKSTSTKTRINISENSFSINNLSFDFIPQFDFFGYVKGQITIPITMNTKFKISMIDHENRKLKISEISFEITKLELSDIYLINDGYKILIQTCLSYLTELEIDIFLIPNIIDFDSFSLAKVHKALIFQTNFDFSLDLLGVKTFEKLII